MASALELDFRMHAERTPNPHSIKWVLSRPVVEAGGSAHFEQAPEPDVSALATALFAVAGVTGVFLGPGFVTVTKRESDEWLDLAEPIVAAIKGWAASGEPALGPGWRPPETSDAAGVESRIREILEQEIRPYVAMDGGEVVFSGFRDGVVEVYLQGACSGCPSSSVTLKMGIEARLKEAIPEVERVVAL